MREGLLLCKRMEMGVFLGGKITWRRGPGASFTGGENNETIVCHSCGLNLGKEE